VEVLRDILAARLEAGDEKSWSIAMAGLRALAQKDPEVHWKAFITLGTGKRKNDKRSIELGRP